MTIQIYTLFNVILSEIYFFAFEKIAMKKEALTGAIATILIMLWVMNVSFIGLLINIALSSRNGGASLWEWLLLFLNMAYGFLRGSDRVARINKKAGNL